MTDKFNNISMNVRRMISFNYPKNIIWSDYRKSKMFKKPRARVRKCLTLVSNDCLTLF